MLPMFALAASLLLTTAASAADQPVAKPVVADKKICRAAVDTGSLIKSHKSCRTKQQWAEIDHANDVQVRSFADHNVAAGRLPN